MNYKDLIIGLEFAVKYELTPKEMETLLLFLGKTSTTAEAAKILATKPRTLHHIIYRLKLKGILSVESRDSAGNNLYRFNNKV